ncbi:MAG: MazG-like family protein [Gammaproteobacteria bacterium]
MNKDWVTDLQQELARFARDRDWEEYHTPRNLAALIASEAGELLALFRWGQDALAESPDAVRQELADVFLGVLRFADQAGINLEQVSREKIKTNASNYRAAPGDTLPDRPRESG